MGQVNLTRIGLNYLKPGGSITLTTGILAERPVPMATSASMVNGAIHSFVLSLAKEDLNGKRVNVIAPALVEDSAEKYGAFFKGQPVVTMESVAKAYAKSVESDSHGEIIRVY
jgi:NAD(P)-dependent dehydrogenase (short-subunit alcohol dehydrogenase family)